MIFFAQNWIVGLQGDAFTPMLERSKYYSGEHHIAIHELGRQTLQQCKAQCANQVTSCEVSGTFWLVQNH